jgi:Helix-turn-helix domain
VSEHAQDSDDVSAPQTILLSKRARTPSPRPIQLETLAPPTALRASVSPPQPVLAPEGREPFTPPDTVFTGEVLRRAREARGLSVEQICERTRITRQHVENLEGDRHDRLPPVVYLRGMLMALAKELRLDGQKVARSYLDAIRAAAAGDGSR